jgi:hypothetical protein
MAWGSFFERCGLLGYDFIAIAFGVFEAFVLPGIESLFGSELTAK